MYDKSILSNSLQEQVWEEEIQLETVTEREHRWGTEQMYESAVSDDKSIKPLTTGTGEMGIAWDRISVNFLTDSSTLKMENMDSL